MSQNVKQHHYQMVISLEVNQALNKLGRFKQSTYSRFSYLRFKSFKVICESFLTIEICVKELSMFMCIPFFKGCSESLIRQRVLFLLIDAKPWMISITK